MKPGDKPIGFWRVPPDMTDEEFDALAEEITRQIVESIDAQSRHIAGQATPATPTPDHRVSRVPGPRPGGSQTTDD